MADPNIQTLVFPVNTSTPGVVKTYTAEVNKKTGAMVVYDTTNLSQKDPVIRNEFTVGTTDPEKKWRSEYYWNREVLENYTKLSREERLFLNQVVEPQAINQRAAYVNKNFTQDQINNLFPGMPRVQNTAPPAPNFTSGGTTISANDESPTDITTIALPEQINYEKSEEFGTLIYPEQIDGNGQDYIKFQVFEYISQKLSDNNLLFEQRGEYKDIKGEIILPIQPTIMDTNTVTWNDSRMGILEMMGANISLSGMNSAGDDYMTNMAKKFGETIKGPNGKPVDQSVVTAVQNYIAKMAVNSNTNLLSRTGGAITNPNLTLLFESPDLRNFTFNFKLTPRTNKEGTIVRKIIRKFKEHMAAQRSSGNLFLETPNVFNISYIRGKDAVSEKSGIHKSLNLFKTCALRSFSVNYTPSGTYMTYNDEAGTMTSYDLTMAFTELEPVYWNDYQSTEIADDQIGY